MRNIPYQEVDVTNDLATRDRLFKLTNMSTVPVSIKGDDFVVGFNPAKLAQLA